MEPKYQELKEIMKRLEGRDFKDHEVVSFGKLWLRFIARVHQMKGESKNNDPRKK